MNQNPDDPTAYRSAARRQTRGRAVLAVVALVLFALLGWWAAAHWLDGDRVSTDNAYVHGNVIVVTPQRTGTVLAIRADDTDRVEAGQVLVTLDATDERNALQHKSSQLARVVRETRAMYLEADALRSNVTIRESELVRARAELSLATDAWTRRETLHRSNAISREELKNAQVGYESARSRLAAAEAGLAAGREALRAHLALTEGVSIERHPSIVAAAAEVREAWLAVQRAEVCAPLSGYVARRNVQVGQRVEAGSNLMSIVELDKVWVEANFKEAQLRRIRIGQPVVLTADLYGKSLVYEGRVAGLAAGTGSAFALLPAQNATGNWIKVVQRVPVRISLDPAQLATYPLRLGLSMRLTVDTADQTGPMLDDVHNQAPVVETTIFASLEQGAAEWVRHIIDSHLGPARSRGIAESVATTRRKAQ